MGRRYRTESKITNRHTTSKSKPSFLERVNIEIAGKKSRSLHHSSSIYQFKPIMDVTEILQAHEAKYKPITVEKLVPLDFDVNLLAGFDTNALEEKKLKSKNNVEKYLLELTRDNTQLIVNELFKLPVSSADAGVLAELPARTSTLPREKPLPKDKPLSKWEKFAKTKGIQKRKKDRMVFDEATGKYVPRWGYKPKEKGELDQDWLIPVPDNADPLEDQYEKKKEAKKARVEKNTKQFKRNRGI